MTNDSASEKILETLSDDFFIQIVENKLQLTSDEFKLKLVLLTPGDDENESSLKLYRARIKIMRKTSGSQETVQVILIVLNDLFSETKEFNDFKREKRVYEDVIPEFEKILEDSRISVEFGPTSIKFESVPHQVMILEDFQDHQLALKDRKIGLGLDHSKMVLAKLAKFHAASAVQYEYQEGIFTDELVKKLPPIVKDSPYYQSMENILNTFRRKVTSWPGYDHYKEIFDKWDVSKAISILTEIAEPTKSGFVVLNHGNLWMNNLLFRENKDEVSDVAFIDFQSSFWGSPAYDFFYFYVSSVRDNIKVLGYDDFVAHYHFELMECLLSLGYRKPIPTLDDIKLEFSNNSGIAVICLMLILSVAKCDSSEKLYIDALLENGDQNEFLDNIYKSEFYVRAVKVLLPFFHSSGFLDQLCF